MGASIGWGVFFERVLTVCFRFLALRMLTTSVIFIAFRSWIEASWGLVLVGVCFLRES